MLCQRCHKNNATVHVKQIINGEVSQLMLCAECAEKENFGSFFGIGNDNLFSGFFSDSILGNTFTSEKKVCPLCKSTRRDLARTGRAGCAKCYEVFSDELSKIIYGIHGNTTHSGSAPGRHIEEIEKNKEIDALKKEQETAILEEDYEKAAEIRDKIKAIENVTSNNLEKKNGEDK